MLTETVYVVLYMVRSYDRTFNSQDYTTLEQAHARIRELKALHVDLNARIEQRTVVYECAGYSETSKFVRFE